MRGSSPGANVSRSLREVGTSESRIDGKMAEKTARFRLQASSVF